MKKPLSEPSEVAKMSGKQIAKHIDVKCSEIGEQFLEHARDNLYNVWKQTLALLQKTMNDVTPVLLFNTVMDTLKNRTVDFDDIMHFDNVWDLFYDFEGWHYFIGILTVSKEETVLQMCYNIPYNFFKVILNKAQYELIYNLLSEYNTDSDIEQNRKKPWETE
jgi:hypothetical protein